MCVCVYAHVFVCVCSEFVCVACMHSINDLFVFVHFMFFYMCTSICVGNV